MFVDLGVAWRRNESSLVFTISIVAVIHHICLRLIELSPSVEGSSADYEWAATETVTSTAYAPIQTISDLLRQIGNWMGNPVDCAVRLSRLSVEWTDNLSICGWAKQHAMTTSNSMKTEVEPQETGEAYVPFG